MSVFQAVKGNVDIVDAAQRYGMAVNRHKKAICPFHDDTNPSLSFKAERFTCFSCGAKGDVIDLVGYLIHARTPLETIKELNHSYGLGIDLDGPPDLEAARIARRKKMERDLFNSWEKEASRIFNAYLYHLRQWKKTYAPSRPGHTLHPLFLEACEQMEYIEHIVDRIFIGGSEADKKRFYLSHSRDVEQLGQRLKEMEQDDEADSLCCEIEPFHIYGNQTESK